MTDESNQPPVIPTEPEGRAEESLKDQKTEAEHQHKGLFHHGCKNCDKHKKDSDEHFNNWRRALADYDNLKKETASRRAEWAQYSEQQILEEFIPVYEHLKLALQGANESNSWLEGVKYVLKQFSDIFKAHGVEEIKTVGEKFDPNLHEAVGHKSEPDGSIHGKPESDIIVKEIAGGYKMGERVIRAAKVIIAK